MILQAGTYTLDLSRPRVMSIINITPDSFYSGSRTSERDAIAERVRTAVEQGASILDVGGYSSRPGAADVSPEAELSRVLLGVEVIRQEAPDALISLDTFRASVAKAVVMRFGPCLINDITAGEADPEMIPWVAASELPYVAMQMRGTPQTMQQLTDYENITEEILRYFTRKIDQLQRAGIRQVILDPGFGFAKTLEQNYRLLGDLHRLTALGCPVLAGVSRKSMIYKPLDTTPQEALNGTTALHWECLRQGASLLRVHDTQQAMEVIRLFELFTHAHENNA